MGEGNPGEAITREFYGAAREETRRAHSLLIVDSIQAGLRARGALSIVDYPGFADAEAPDMETYSKACAGMCVCVCVCVCCVYVCTRVRGPVCYLLWSV